MKIEKGSKKRTQERKSGGRGKGRGGVVKRKKVKEGKGGKGGE